MTFSLHFCVLLRVLIVNLKEVFAKKLLLKLLIVNLQEVFANMLFLSIIFFLILDITYYLQIIIVFWFFMPIGYIVYFTITFKRVNLYLSCLMPIYFLFYNWFFYYNYVSLCILVLLTILTFVNVIITISNYGEESNKTKSWCLFVWLKKPIILIPLILIIIIRHIFGLHGLDCISTFSYVYSIWPLSTFFIIYFLAKLEGNPNAFSHAVIETSKSINSEKAIYLLVFYTVFAILLPFIIFSFILAFIFDINVLDSLNMNRINIADLLNPAPGNTPPGNIQSENPAPGNTPPGNTQPETSSPEDPQPVADTVIRQRGDLMVKIVGRNYTNPLVYDSNNTQNCSTLPSDITNTPNWRYGSFIHNGLRTGAIPNDGSHRNIFGVRCIGTFRASEQWISIPCHPSLNINHYTTGGGRDIYVNRIDGVDYMQLRLSVSRSNNFTQH